MADELNRLSPEQVKKLGDAINGAKNLTNQQAEIIERVIQGEIEINNLRMANLQSYFDVFSRNLDMVARKFSSINDTCLIINEQLSDASEFAIKTNDGGSGGNGSSGSSGGSSGDSGNGGKAKKVQNVISDEGREDFQEDTNPEAEINRREVVLNRLNELTANYYKSQEEQENDFSALQSNLRELEIARQNARNAKTEEHYASLTSLEKDLQKLRMLQYEEAEDRENRLTSIKLSRQQDVVDAEIGAYTLLRNMQAEMAYDGAENFKDKDGNDTGVNEAGALAAKKRSAVAMQAYLKKQDDARQAYIAKKEREYAAKNNGILTKEAATRARKEADEKFKLDEKRLEKLAAKEQLYQDALTAKKERGEMRGLINQARSAETTTERVQALKELTTTNGHFDFKKSMTAAVLAVSDLAKQLEGTIDEIASFRGPIDTRLYGSVSNQKSSGSYWNQMVKDMTAVGAINPFYKQTDFANNIKELVDTGIAFNIQQRAFLKTVTNKIATTFNVADATLLRLVRIQQEDSTAGRMGMEAAMNAFLNQMYENTEYLKSVASSVRSSLGEMESLMTGAEAAEVEFQVQKWMGSLYSVGMSQEAVNAISTALGQIAAGQVEGIINGGAGNLLVMAANDAGYSIADFLTDGITAEKTNILLENAVKYLAELAESAEGNKIVQQQLANVFGVKASDLRAATNLVLPGSIAGISGKNMSYGDMMSTLYDMAGSMIDRTSIAEMMTNFWKNGEYTLAGSMASNPVSYFIYKMASVVDDAAGGIDLPFLNVMGFGVDLNTTVSDLMRVAAVGAGLLGSIGPLVSGLGNSFSGRKMLDQLKFGSGGLAVTPRGSGDGGGGGNTSGSSTSGSGYVGNASGSDVKDSTIQESEDSKKQQMIEAKEEEEANKVDFLNETVLKIYELLDDVASGKSSFKVQVDGYGLTKSSTKSNAAMGGIAGLEGDSAASSGNSASSSGGGVNTGGVGGGVDFGGWTST